VQRFQPVREPTRFLVYDLERALTLFVGADATNSNVSENMRI